MLVITSRIALRMSRSRQSSVVTGAVSTEPPHRTCLIAGLRPGNPGPPNEKQWPNIRPAIKKSSLSTITAEFDGTKWFTSPSKIFVIGPCPSYNKESNDKKYKNRWSIAEFTLQVLNTDQHQSGILF